MSNLKEMQEFQKKFDEKHGWIWTKPKDMKEKLEALQSMIIALLGELGEFANVVKKVTRDYNTLGVVSDKEYSEKLKEELTDCLIYLVILANILHMDLEKEYFKKMEYNDKRFKKYRKK